MSDFEVMDDPASAGIDPDALAALLERAERDVDSGLLPSCQIALAREGRLVAHASFGDATDDTRYVIFSATKPITAAAAWTLIGEGKLDPSRRVAEVFPEFAANGKDAVTIEQVMLHTSGFPTAPMNHQAASDRQMRIEKMASWWLNWEPGTRFEYHPTSAHWVLAEVIERLAGDDFRTVIHERVTGPLGLRQIVGAPLADQDGVAPLIAVGEPPSSDELLAVLGVSALDVGEVTEENLLMFNRPEVRAVGVPGGGGVATAADLALFYQGLLHNPGGIFKPDVLRDVTTNVRNRFPDPVLGVPSNRSLGLVLCGADGRGHMRQGSFGKTNSPGAFGHAGAHGQLAWADPATGLSFGYCTNGMDRNPIREGKRSVGLSSRAALCFTVIAT